MDCAVFFTNDAHCCTLFLSPQKIHVPFQLVVWQASVGFLCLATQGGKRCVSRAPVIAVPAAAAAAAVDAKVGTVLPGSAFIASPRAIATGIVRHDLPPRMVSAC